MMSWQVTGAVTTARNNRPTHSLRVGETDASVASQCRKSFPPWGQSLPSTAMPTVGKSIEVRGLMGALTQAPPPSCASAMTGMPRSSMRQVADHGNEPRAARLTSRCNEACTDRKFNPIKPSMAGAASDKGTTRCGPGQQPPKCRCLPTC